MALGMNQEFLRKMAALSMVLVSESISATLIIPFVGLFVAHLQGVTPEESGYISGILVSVFQLGQVLTAKFWGKLSDRFGRKPMIEVGLLLNAIASVFFGVSPSIEFCIFMRFIHGCANGNVLVAKTVIADITDKTNEGFGFSTISLFWGVGSIIGPMLGGMLYNPTGNAFLCRIFPLENVAWDVFKIHPAMLPAMVISAFSFFTLFFICLFLPETSKNAVDPLLSMCCSRKINVDYVVNEEEVGEKPSDLEHLVATTDAGGDDHISSCKVGDVPPWLPQKKEVITTDETLQCSVYVEGSTVAPGMRNRRHVNSIEDVGSEMKTSFNLGYREALQSPNIRIVLIMYMCICSTECALLEVIPLWAIASIEKGGLSFTSSEVGALMSAVSLVCIVASISFSFLLRYLNNDRLLWDFSVILWAITCIATPCAVCLPSEWVFVYTAIVTSIREVGLSWSYALIYLFISRSAPEGQTGLMNGIAQSIGSYSRMVTMMVLPPLFAWSLRSNQFFPFNHHFVFWLSILPLLASYILSTFVSSSILSA